MCGRRLAAVVLALSLSGSAQAVSTSIPPANQPITGSQVALEKLAQAYRRMSVAEVGAMLTADYRFHAVGANGENLSRFADGSPREAEMGAVRGMLEGVVREGKLVMPKADSVGVSFDGISEGVDPEHADSTEQYRDLTVTRAQFGIRLANGNHWTNPPRLHVFHDVRGDAAVLVPGQPADPERWYIRRWLEDVSGLRAALNERKGDCGE